MFIQHPLLKTKRTKMENWSRNFQTGIISDTCLDWFSSLTFCEWPLVIFIIFLRGLCDFFGYGVGKLNQRTL